MSTHKAVVRYKAGTTDVTVYALDHTSQVTHIGLKFHGMDLVQHLSIKEARELRHVLNWCMKQAGEER
ncbi:hypothetical protein LCGC14_2133730 [marine sediment metagenome]|uniref:Uncharacterized protein n=1 Tax=marine sediment metagenome TaxID=412755 RepID=A0A0F9GDL8_9ZZZZ